MYAQLGSYIGLKVYYEDDKFLFLGDRDIVDEIKTKLLTIIKDDINFGAYYDGDDRYLVIRKC